MNVKIERTKLLAHLTEKLNKANEFNATVVAAEKEHDLAHKKWERELFKFMSKNFDALQFTHESSYRAPSNFGFRISESVPNFPPRPTRPEGTKYNTRELESVISALSMSDVKYVSSSVVKSIQAWL